MRESNLGTPDAHNDLLFNLPKVSVDVVALHVTERGDVQLTLIKRANEPYAGEFALPGVLLRRDETLDAAARRALTTKAGLAEPEIGPVAQVQTFDSPDRDPRGHTLSVSLFTVVDRAEHGVSVDDAAVARLPFGHGEIVAQARKVVGRELFTDPALMRRMLGSRFPTAKALHVASALTGTTPEKANFNRMLSRLGFLRATEVKAALGPGRPSTVWEVAG